MSEITVSTRLLYVIEAMLSPSLARVRATVAIWRPAPFISGWEILAEMPLVNAGLTRELSELVALRETFVLMLTVPLVAAILGSVAPTLIVVESLRGPVDAVPSRRLVVEADWLTARRAEAVRVGSETASCTATASLAEETA